MIPVGSNLKACSQLPLNEFMSDNSDSLDELRLGLVGAGRSGIAFARVCEGLHGCRLSAVCDLEPERAAGIVGAKPFKEFDQLLAFPEIDALVIATNIGHRGEIALQSLKIGLPVLARAPVSADKALNEEIMTLVSKSRGKLVCGIWRPLRFSVRGRKLKDLTDGAFGRPFRVQWTLTDRFCDEASALKIAQKGEEPLGTLLNSLREELDLLLWLLGEPDFIEASQVIGKHHDVEVQDEVFLRLAWDDGATCCFVASSGEIPGVDRLEMIGDRGLIVSERDRPIHWNRCEKSVEEFSRSIKNSSTKLASWEIEIPTQPSGPEIDHEAILLDFSDSIRLGGKPVSGPKDDAMLLRLQSRIAECLS